MRHHVSKSGFHIDASAHGREVAYCNTKLLAQAGASKAALAQLWGCKRMFLLLIAKAKLRQKGSSRQRFGRAEQLSSADSVSSNAATLESSHFAGRELPSERRIPGSAGTDEPGFLQAQFSAC